MNEMRFDDLTRMLSGVLTGGTTRRATSRYLGGLALTCSLVASSLHQARAKGGHKKKDEKKVRVCICAGIDPGTCKSQRKPKKKAKKSLRRNACAYRGRCKGVSGCPPLTVGATFTIDACWKVDADHDTFLRVPNAAGSTDENPFIKYDCNPGGGCATEYPFACVNEDVANDPGCEVTTVYQRLGGQYQYWSELDPASPAGEVTVTLRDSGGGVLATWSSPAIPGGVSEIGWHVFDIDGSTGIVTSVNQTVGEDLPDAFGSTVTDV